MAESKFLKYQDKSGNLLADVCEEAADVEEVQNCDLCKPDNCAVVPDWKYLTSADPFFNAKLCKYQVTLRTSLTSILGLAEDLSDLSAEFMDEAAEALLVGFDKDTSITSLDTIKASLEYTQYDLNPRPGSRLKLLFSIESYVLELIPPSESDDEEDTESDADNEGTGPTTSYFPVEVAMDVLKIRKTLRLYETYRSVFNSIEGGNLIVTDTGKPFSLRRYGDRGIMGGSVMANILPELDAFFNSKGYNLPSMGPPVFRKEKIEKFDITFTDKYKIKKISIYTKGCGGKPINFRGKKLRSLRAKQTFKNATAMAYFSRSSEMVQDITARVPMPWLEFAIKYTYPGIYETYTYPAATSEQLQASRDPTLREPYYNYPADQTENSGTEIILKRLKEEGKQLGQDITSDVLSLYKALAYQFNQNLCELTPEEVLAKKTELGLIYDADTDSHKALFVAAQEQAFKVLEKSEMSFPKLCDRILSPGPGGTKQPGTSGVEEEPEESKYTAAESVAFEAAWAAHSVSSKAKEAMWETLNTLKTCGMTDLMMETMQCLMKGLTLEESLSSIVSSAFRGMSLESFGDFFVGLPEAKRKELDKLVRKDLNSGRFFDPGATWSRGAEISAGIEEGTSLPRPWERGERKQNKAERKAKRDLRKANEPLISRAPLAASENDPTLAQKYQALDADPGAGLNEGVIMEAYFKALIEVYGGNLLDLVDALNQMPGAQLMATVLTSMQCPRPPILEPSVMDFIKDIELPFCRSKEVPTLPQLVNPFGFWPKWADLTSALKDAAKLAIQQAIVSVVMKLLVKLCTSLGTAMCQAVGSFGDAAMANLFPEPSSRDPYSSALIENFIADSIAGTETSDAEVRSTVIEVFKLLGTGLVEFADEESILDFAGDISAAVTRTELMNAMLSQPSVGFVEIVDTLIEHDYPQFRAGLSTKDDIKDFFTNVGNLMPAPVKNSLRDFVDSVPENDMTPANPSFCSNQETLDAFCQLRQELLEGRATPEQAKQMCEDARQDLKDEVEDISCVMQGGISNAMMNALPPLVSDPGCNDGLMPYEPAILASSTADSLSRIIKQIKVAYSTDILGNGGILLGKDGWGMLNMIMCDTMGNPRTRHNRKSYYRKNYVDFYLNSGDDDLYGRFGNIRNQEGAYPYRVAGWLQDQLKGNLESTGGSDLIDNLSFKSTNDFQPTNTTIANLKRVEKLNMMIMPEMGYNVTFALDAQADEISVIEIGRKATSDVTLQFRDNGKGYRLGPNSADSAYSYGFKMEIFLSDLEPNIPYNEGYEATYSTTKGQNILSDNIRVKITELNNSAAKISSMAAELATEDEEVDLTDGQDNDTSGVLPDLKYEFFATDDVLENIIEKWSSDPAAHRSPNRTLLEHYPTFAACFEAPSPEAPQISLLKDIINESRDPAISQSDVKDLYDSFMKYLMTHFVSLVGSNDDAFLYGATFDDLTTEDVEYLIPDDSEASPAGALYAEGTVADENGDDVSLTNKNMILGISRMQYEVELILLYIFSLLNKRAGLEL